MTRKTIEPTDMVNFSAFNAPVLFAELSKHTDIRHGTVIVNKATGYTFIYDGLRWVPKMNANITIADLMDDIGKAEAKIKTLYKALNDLHFGKRGYDLTNREIDQELADGS